MLLCLIWLMQGSDFFMYKIFAPKYEAVRRETFEQTKSYNQGMVQDLAALYLEYGKSSKEHQDAIVSVVQHRFADLPEDRVPSYLQSFLEKCRNGTMGESR